MVGAYSTSYLDLLIVPRVQKKGKKRPPRALLLRPYAMTTWGARKIKDEVPEEGSFTVRKMVIKGGLLLKYSEQKKTVSTIPRDLEELAPFAESCISIGYRKYHDFIFKTIDNIKNRDHTTTFYPGDRIAVRQGTYIGMKGKVQEVEDTTARIMFEDINADYEATVLLEDIVREFRPGDNVRVRRGIEIGRREVVVNVDEAVLMFAETDLKVGDPSRGGEKPLTTSHVSPFLANPCTRDSYCL